VPDNESTTPKIARIWRGRTTRDKADAYLQYWREEGGFYPLADKALAVQMLREDCDDETEFITISWWPSVEAMSAFAGNDPTQIHHLPRDPEFLIELPQRVQILEVVNATWIAPRAEDWPERS
jgi:heme-degrading monooxygenase HmoA